MAAKNLIWKDKKSIDDTFLSLEIDNAEIPKSSFKIYSGGKGRFRVDIENIPVLFGTIDNVRHCAWCMRTGYKDFNAIPAISSNQIEKSNDSTFSKVAFWSRFFANQLLTPSLSNQNYQIRFRPKFDERAPGLMGIDKVEEAFSDFPFREIDWANMGCSNVDFLISLKPEANKDLGRLKWWRKKVRNNEAPPILVVFCHPLDCFLILDGHLRLQAYLLENVIPDFICLETFNSETIDNQGRIDLAHLKLEKREREFWKPEFTVIEKNKLLVEAYGPLVFEKSITNAQAQNFIEFEKEWTESVIELADQNLRNREEFKSFLRCHKPY